LAHRGREHILIISHSYTPFINPRAFRWSAIAEYWAQEGKDVDVVCSWLPGLRRYELVNGVEVHRIGGNVTERLRARLRPTTRTTVESSSKIAENATNTPVRKLGNWIIGALRFFHDVIWKNIYWPDYACLWINSAATKALELCNMVRYDAVISVSDPFSSHLAGQSVKIAFPEKKWMVDIGDPFCFRHDNATNNHKLYRKYNYQAEEKVITKADIVTVTNGDTKAKYSELFPGCSNKIQVIHPMMKEIDLPQNRERILPENNRTKLVYVGTLYRSIRNPEYLLKMFLELKALPNSKVIELHIFGGYDDCRDIFDAYRSRLGDKLVLHGLVSRSKVLAAMSEADVLVNIGNDNPYQLPSKLVEYSWLGKPIVNLHSIDKDSSKSFLKQYPVILNIHTRSSDPLELQTQKLSQFLQSLPIAIEESFLRNWRTQFGVEAVSNQYAVALEHTRVLEPALV